MHISGIFNPFDTNTTTEISIHNHKKRMMYMKSSNSKQELQQKKQNQSVKKQSGNPKLDGENRPST